MNRDDAARVAHAWIALARNHARTVAQPLDSTNRFARSAGANACAPTAGCWKRDRAARARDAVASRRRTRYEVIVGRARQGADSREDGAAGRRRGRGALSNPAGRYESTAASAFDDGWGIVEEPPRALATTVTPESTRQIITRNDSPDIWFDRSINPYKGCEHGCVYCFARPTHAYLGLSPGLDFETRIFSKPDAAALLRRELARPGYRAEVLALGANTDPYQPVERDLGITRAVLEVLAEHRHPVGIVTKSALVLRDVDLLASMAAERLAHVYLSVTTLDPALAATMEPRAATPARRLDAIRGLHEAGVPVGVLSSPMIPGLNDWELERILDAAVAAGATSANYVLLRLPLELKELFEEWLRTHRPERADHVLSLVRDTRGGALYQNAFGTRMRGTGRYAELIEQRFELARRRLGLARRAEGFDGSRFRVPAGPAGQLSLFD